MKNYEKEVLEILVDKLEDYEGNTVKGYDLPDMLLEEELANGSVDCNSLTAKNWIKNNFEDFCDLDLAEYISPFANPEVFQVGVYINTAVSILSECEFVSQNWDNYIMLNEKTITIIKKQLLQQLKN